MTTPAGDALSQAAAAIRNARAITAVCHENPDADTVAAALAIAYVGGLLGKETEVVSADGIPPNLHFLPGAEAVRHRPELAADLVVTCDAATLERVGPLMRHRDDLWSGSTLLNLDHHRTNTRFADINMVDPDAAATCQVLAELLPVLEVVLDAPLATLLLTGIVRDTQGFSEPATAPTTLELAADLTRAGAPLAEIQRRVLGALPIQTLQVWGRLLASAIADMGGRVIYTILTPQMLHETGAKQHDADGVVEFIARSTDAEVVLLLRQLPDSATRVSIRSAGPVDATLIAGAFGGGGHASRAGFITERPAVSVLPSLLEATRRLLGAEPTGQS